MAAAFLIICIILQTGCGRHNETMTPDEQAIAQLKQAGSDLSKPHPVEFYLYLPTKESAENVGAALSSKRFSVEVRPAAIGNMWLCLAKRDMVPEASTLVSARRMLTELATKFGGEYDGWEAEVVR